MRRFASLSFLVFVTVSLCASHNLRAVDNDSRIDDPNEMVTAVHKFCDLPAFTAKGNFNPDVMMRLIRATTSPSEWKEHGGKSTYISYPENLSLVITTQRRTHDKISDLLKEFRSETTTD